MNIKKIFGLLSLAFIPALAVGCKTLGGGYNENSPLPPSAAAAEQTKKRQPGPAEIKLQNQLKNRRHLLPSPEKLFTAMKLTSVSILKNPVLSTSAKSALPAAGPSIQPQTALLSSFLKAEL